MPFSAQELANIFSSSIDFYMDRGKVFKQNVQEKPMLQAFEESASTFPGGKESISIGIKSGQGGGSLAGYTHDDQVGYYNPASNKRANFAWREHHIGIGVTHTELKKDGITVNEEDGEQSTSEKSGREQQALANLLDEKLDDFREDYRTSLNSLIHSDGTADAKALAGIKAFVLDVPNVGSTGGVGRVANPWWANRAATVAFGGLGGQGAITSNTANGGALLQFLQKEGRQLNRYAQGGVKRRHFAGTDFIAAMETELRANGNYTLQGFSMEKSTTGDMATVSWLGQPIKYDPILDDLGLSKRLYSIDMRRIRLLYMAGERMKKTAPARPYDRYVLYRGITSTMGMVCQQLNTSGVYDIA